MALPPSEVMTGVGYQHRVFSANVRRDTERLHIYFAGDGAPFVRKTQVARDPTPRRPYTLRLMRADPTPAVLIGRPCYHGLARHCDPRMWTSARYSQAVAASLAAVVERTIEAYPRARVTLIGYSGGGTLALLVAQRVERVETVVTIAANLDIDAWADVHGYTPLSESINPVKHASWRSSLRQIHLAGSRDANVPAHIARDFARNHPGAEVRLLEGFDHTCCWVDAWPALLTDLY